MTWLNAYTKRKLHVKMKEQLTFLNPILHEPTVLWRLSKKEQIHLLT